VDVVTPALSRRSFLAGVLAAPVAVPAVAASVPPTVVWQSRLIFAGSERVLETTEFSDGVTTSRIRSRLPGEMFRRGTASVDELSRVIAARETHDGAPAAPAEGALPASAGAPS
jgi:hypothetical protein